MILRNKKTESAWVVFYWLFAVSAALGNILLMVKVCIAVGTSSAFDRLARRCLPCAFLFAFVLFILMIMVFFAPIFAVFPIRQVWRTIAWSQSCNDWEITAVLTGVTWNKFYRSLPLVG